MIGLIQTARRARMIAVFAAILGVELLCAAFAAAGVEDILPFDRYIDWSTAGVLQTNGVRGIPNVSTVFANVKNAPYNAAGNGIANDTLAIQNAIDACPDNQVVYLPAGTYKTTGLQIDKSIVIRGAGPGSTTILAGGSIVFNKYGNELSIPDESGNHQINWTAGYNKGDTVITLANTTGLAVGQEIILDQLNDTAVVLPGYIPVVNPYGNEGTPGEGVNNWASRDGLSWGTDGTHPTPRARNQMARVTAINGNQVTIDTPLTYTHLASLSPQVFFWEDGNLRYAGIENLKIEGLQEDGTYGSQILAFLFCTNCWAKGIEIDHMERGAIFSMYNYHLEIRNSYFYKGYEAAPTNYVMEIADTHASLIENNIFDSTIGGVTLGYPNAGNVIAYNYAVRENQTTGGSSAVLFPALATHDVHNHSNLFEGNNVGAVVFDVIWGSGSNQTVFRNRLRGFLPPIDIGGGALWSNDNYPLFIQSWNRFINAVGNVLGTQDVPIKYEISRTPQEAVETVNLPAYSFAAGAIYTLGYYYKNDTTDMYNYDTVTADTFLRWGNYDYFTNQARWDASEIPAGSTAPATHVLPDSFYLPSKPVWWGDAVWPAIGPDVTGYSQPLPAQLCYESGPGSGNPFDPSFYDHAVSPDISSPTVTMTVPANGATVSGAAVTVRATASDASGIAGVRFKLDGANLGAEDTSAPYSVTWNTTLSPDGTHTLIAVARDAAGHTTTSSVIIVTVANTPTGGVQPNLDHVRSFPNPYRPGSSTQGGAGIVFDRLTSKATIKIFSVSGALIREIEKTDTGSSFAIWDGKNENGQASVSGIYVYTVTNPDNGAQKAKGKIAVVR